MNTTLHATRRLRARKIVSHYLAALFSGAVFVLVLVGPARSDEKTGDESADTRVGGTATGSTIDEYAATRTRYAEAISLQQYAEAEVAAKQMLRQEIASGRQQSPEYAHTLCDLAYAQRRLGKTDAALTNYVAAVGAIESEEGRLSDRLVVPLYGAGMTNLDAGRADLALAFLDRTLHTIHVNSGPHALEQAYVLEAEIDAYDQLDDIETVKGLASRLYGIHSREYGEGSMKMVPVTLEVAGIYGRMGLLTEEREAYTAAVELIRDGMSDNALELIDPYLAIARTYLYQRRDRQFVPSAMEDTGETWLRRALQIVEQNDQADWQTETRVKLALADYYTISDQARNARKYYDQVWNLLSEDAEHLAERRKNLEQVVALVEADSGNLESMRSDLPEASSAKAGTGKMKATYVIDEDGHVSDVRIIESEPPKQGDIEAHLKRSLENFIYRPRYENGVAVASIDQQFSYTFAYEKPDDEPAAKKTQP